MFFCSGSALFGINIAIQILHLDAFALSFILD